MITCVNCHIVKPLLAVDPRPAFKPSRNKTSQTRRCYDQQQQEQIFIEEFFQLACKEYTQTQKTNHGSGNPQAPSPGFSWPKKAEQTAAQEEEEEK